MAKKGNAFKKVLWIILGIAVLYGVFKLGALNRTKIHEVVTPTDTKSETEVPIQTTDITASKKVYTYTDTHYKISIEYPEFTGMTDKKIEATINGDMATKAGELATSFKSDTENGISPTDGDYTQDGDYKFYGASHGTIGAELRLSEYVFHAAHPNNYSATLNYRLTDGATITITDLCKTSSCLTQIATLTQKYLKTTLSKMGVYYDDTAKQGSSANTDNYQDFLLTKEGLKIIFDPYQVAPYAVGTVYVTIPWSDLASILKTEYLK